MSEVVLCYDLGTIETKGQVYLQIAAYIFKKVGKSIGINLDSEKKN